jgi:hypothetical protein
MKKDPIVVLGMPQSGCSTVARALTLLGVDFGTPAEMVRVDESAPGGHFEQSALTGFNRRCLSSLQLHPLSSRAMPANWRSHPLAPGMREVLRRAISERLGKGQSGIKQPMACLLLPLYQEVFSELGLCPHYVVCLRDPVQIGSSGFTWIDESGASSFAPAGQVAVGAWLNYTLSALEAGSSAQLTVVPYEAMLDSPGPVLHRILKKAPWLTFSDTDFSRATESIRSIPHCPAVTTAALSDYPPLVANTFELCCRLASDESEIVGLPSLIAEFDLWREMLAPPGNPGTRLGFAWIESGRAETAQVPFLPSGEWQTVRLMVPAPPSTQLSGVLYGRPCRIWFKRCLWRFGSSQMQAQLLSGPGSQLVQSGGFLRLEASYEAGQVSVKTPSTPGPYELEIEFLLEAGPLITAEVSRRLAERLQECAVRHERLVKGR